MSCYEATEAEPKSQGHARVSMLSLDGASVGPKAELLILSTATYLPTLQPMARQTWSSHVPFRKGRLEALRAAAVCTAWPLTFWSQMILLPL